MSRPAQLPYADPFTLPIIDAEIVAIDLDALPEQRRTQELQPYVAPIPYVKPKRGLIRRAIDDPFWILMGITGSLVLAIVGTIIYGVIQIVLGVVAFLNEWGATIGGGAVAVILALILCGGGTAVCAGIHCAGCKG